MSYSIIEFPRPEPTPLRRFTVGQALETRSACDHDCVYEGTVVSRSEKMVQIDLKDRKVRVKIHTDEDGNEFCYPHGRYSMAPVFNA